MRRFKKDKPAKPSPDFPLTPHNSGTWCKSIKGKIYYFGTWDDPEGALREYLAKKDYLYAGVAPPRANGHSVYEVLDRFLAARDGDVRLGDLSPVTWKDYRMNCDLILKKIDPDMIVEMMGPAEMAELRIKLCDGVSVTTGANRVRMAKIALRYVETINRDFRINFGKYLKEPSAKQKRKAKLEAGRKLHTAQQIREAVAAANPGMKAMLLLGINCAFGNSDCSRLRWDHLDLAGCWHTYWREKTFVDRRAKLWPETIEAIGNVSQRSDLVFITKYGNSWTTDAISKEAAKLVCASWTAWRRTLFVWRQAVLLRSHHRD